MINSDRFSNQSQAFYFPVSDQPLTMKAGLNEFGTDFGNEQDQNFLQFDCKAKEYKKVKLECNPNRHWATGTCTEHFKLHSQVIHFICKKLNNELGIQPDSSFLSICNKLQNEEQVDNVELNLTYISLSLLFQEDFAILADSPNPSLIMGNITMPSFWSPEKIRESDFDDIHKPVPNFPKTLRGSEKMATLIASKGPFVRFVWTVTNDNRLDHHPDKGKNSWVLNQPLWLRVERQVSVPFNGLGALFLIRTYLYPMEKLNDSQKCTLRTAVESMPEDVARYKGLWDAKKIISENIE